MFYEQFTVVRVRTGVLPAAVNHPARDRPLHSLHHSQVLLVVVSLQRKADEAP